MGSADRPDLTVVVADRRTNTYGPNVVVGALEIQPPPGRIDVRFAALDNLAPMVAATASQSAVVLVAWSFYSADFPASVQLLRDLRAVANPLNVTHLAGGVHASAEALRTLDAGWDLVAVGEGETTMTRLAACLVEGSRIEDVPGLAWLEPDGRLQTSGPAIREELDRFPAFADRHRRYNAIEIIRGCIYACTFCQTPFLFKARFRHRSVANVAAHVEKLRRAGRRDVRFVTPTSLSYGSSDHSVDLDAIGNLLARCRAAIGPTGRVFFGSFPSEVRPEHVSVEALRLLRRYVDNDNLVIGGQSGSEEVLTSSNRGHSVAAVEEAVRLCLQEGFTPNVDFLFGLPGEDEEAARASVRFAEHLADLGARIHSHTFMPLPGTPLRNAPAGRVSNETGSALDRLAGRGRAYGQFRRQQRVAEQMVNFVGRRRPAPNAD